MFEPVTLWDDVERRLARPGALAGLIGLAVIGGGVIALASEIGVRVFNTDWHRVAGYSVQPNRSWSAFFGLWAVYALAPVIQGLCGAALLKIYRRPRRWNAALAVAIVGAVPLYVAGLSLVLLPGILLVCLAFLVSCMWWASGAEQLLGVASSETADYVAAMLIGASALLFLIAASLPG